MQFSKLPNAPLRVAYLSTILDRLETQNPEHPLLAAFLPYRCSDRVRLRTEGPQAYALIEQTTLPTLAKNCLLSVFWSWLMLRFDELKYQEIMHMFGNLSSLERTQAYRDIVAIGRLEGLKEGTLEGMLKGMIEGKQEGRLSEACALVLRLATRRFSTLPVEVETLIRTLTLTQLETLAEELLEFSTVDNLRLWLTKV